MNEHRFRLCFALILTASLAACSSLTPTAKLTPRVQNCGVLDAGSPSRFACDGKVYTSFQLAKLREDEAKRYASGK